MCSTLEVLAMMCFINFHFELHFMRMPTQSFISFAVICFLSYLPHAVNGCELQIVLFLAPSVYGFSFVYEISPEPLNGFAPNSRGTRAWSLTHTSLKVKVKGQGHQGQKLAFFGPFGGVHAVFVW